MSQLINMTGRRCGRLTVLRRSPHARVLAWWVCRCTCGNVCEVSGSLLRSGNTRSCGCLRRELAACRARKRMLRHGHTKHNQPPTPEYRAWVQMRQRCTNAKKRGFHLYGGRGVRVCRRWRMFEKFFADMGRRPTRRHSLDRKNSNKGYTPSNCRWATAKEQQRNRRDNRRIALHGVTRPLIDWADHFKIKLHTVHWRIDYGNWSVVRALTTPVKRHAR